MVGCHEKYKPLWKMGWLEKAGKEGLVQSLIGRDHFMQAQRKNWV